MNKQLEKLLSSIPLFEDLTPDELQKMISFTKKKSITKGSHVFFKDEPLNSVYFIEKGIVKIYKTDINGKEQIVSLLKEGDMFPHIGFFQSRTYPANALVVEDASFVYLSTSHLQEMVLHYPEVSIKLFRVMEEKIIELQSSLEAQVLNNAYDQVVKLLLRLQHAHGVLQQDGGYMLPIHITQNEIAQMIGAARETVSRSLSKMRKKGLIADSNEGYLLLNVEALHQELYAEN
jgi:CRP/FNR family transcriptional regulator, cyclic AMP receptor protein